MCVSGREEGTALGMMLASSRVLLDNGALVVGVLDVSMIEGTAEGCVEGKFVVEIMEGRTAVGLHVGNTVG